MSLLETAWLQAQPRLASFHNVLDGVKAPFPRVSRVSQLDAQLLDSELVSLLKEPLNMSMSALNASLRGRFDPELTLLIQLTLHRFSIWRTGASYGAMLQDLRYAASASSAAPKYSPGIPKRLLFLHGTLTILLPYAHARCRAYALSRAWPDAPSSDRRRRFWEGLTTLESAYNFLRLATLVAFLWNGRYLDPADFSLGMRLLPSRRITKRDVSYDFMNRQMVWQAFTEFLLFALPLLHVRKARKYVSRLVSSASHQISRTSARKAGEKDGDEPAAREGKFWHLSPDQCAICAENASYSLDLSKPDNIFTSSLTVIPSQEPSTLIHDSDPPQFPIYNPYITSCRHIYCYHCVTERMMHTADDLEESGWECLRCCLSVRFADRYTGDVEPETSDYDFSSDNGSFGEMSASLGSYTESVSVGSYSGLSDE